MGAGPDANIQQRVPSNTMLMKISRTRFIQLPNVRAEPFQFCPARATVIERGVVCACSGSGSRAQAKRGKCVNGVWFMVDGKDVEKKPDLGQKTGKRRIWAAGRGGNWQERCGERGIQEPGKRAIELMKNGKIRWIWVAEARHKAEGTK